MVQYSYTVYGEPRSVSGSLASTIEVYNPFRYKGYYYDVETRMYYCKSRYYVPEWCRWLNGDSIPYLDPSSVVGLNLFSYCGNDPVNFIDPSGSFAVSTFLISLAIGSLISWGLSEIFGNQIAGGISSVSNGAGAKYTGVGMLSFGPVGWIAGGALILIGAGTVAFGVNEIVAEATGTNYLQQWTGMSDGLYNGVYIGLNIASAIDSIAGNAYMRYANVTGNNAGTKGKPFSRYSTIDENEYRFFDSKGNAWYDKGFGHTASGLKFPHYHGWINGVRVKDHWTLW